MCEKEIFSCYFFGIKNSECDIYIKLGNYCIKIKDVLMKIQLHIDFEGAFGLVPFGLNYHNYDAVALEHALKEIRVFSERFDRYVSVKIYVVGALIDKYQKYQEKLFWVMDKYGLSSLNKCCEINKNFFIDKDLLLDVIGNGVEVHSHTYFHANMKEVSLIKDVYNFIADDKRFFDEVYCEIGSLNDFKYQVSFPENIVPYEAYNIYNDIRKGLSPSANKINMLMFNVKLPLLYYKNSFKSYMNNVLNYIFRVMTYRLSGEKVFYTHCHNIIMDDRLFDRFGKYMNNRFAKS